MSGVYQSKPIQQASICPGCIVECYVTAEVFPAYPHDCPVLAAILDQVPVPCAWCVNLRYEAAAIHEHGTAALYCDQHTCPMWHNLETLGCYVEIDE